jgi:hypothetical protein
LHAFYLKDIDLYARDQHCGLDPALQTRKPPSPLVQKILAEMRKHSASKQSQSTMKDKEIDQEPKSENLVYKDLLDDFLPLDYILYK